MRSSLSYRLIFRKGQTFLRSLILLLLLAFLVNAILPSFNFDFNGSAIELTEGTESGSETQEQEEGDEDDHFFMITDYSLQEQIEIRNFGYHSYNLFIPIPEISTPPPEQFWV